MRLYTPLPMIILVLLNYPVNATRQNSLLCTDHVKHHQDIISQCLDKYGKLVNTIKKIKRYRVTGRPTLTNRTSTLKTRLR